MLEKSVVEAYRGVNARRAPERSAADFVNL